MDELEERISNLEASRVALTLMLGSLMATHQNYAGMQLHLTRLLEQQLEAGALGKTLTLGQKEYVREMVEWMQTLKKA